MATTNHDRVLDRREVAAALLRALERRHEVLDAIVESDDRAAAIAAIGSLLDTTDFCAEAVLALPLGRLTKAERKKIRAELDDLDAVVKWTTDSRPYATGEHFRLRPDQRGSGRHRAAEGALRRTARRWKRRGGRGGAPQGRCTDGRRVGHVARGRGLVRRRTEEDRFRIRRAQRQRGRGADLGSPRGTQAGYGTATLKQARTELAAYFPGSTLIIRTPA